MVLIALALAGCDECPLEAKQGDKRPHVVDIEIRGTVTMMLLSNGRVLCWGHDRRGSCGHPSGGTYVYPQYVKDARCLTEARPGEYRHSLGVTADKKVLVWGKEEHLGSAGDGPGGGPKYGQPVVIPELENVRSVEPGTHTFAVTASDELYWWGLIAWALPTYGDSVRTQSDVPKLYPSPVGVVSVASSVDFSCYLGTDGGVYCLGANDRGQLGLPPNPVGQFEPAKIPLPTQAAAVAVGSAFGCALGAAGELYCWGAHPLLQTSPDPTPRLIDGFGVSETLHVDPTGSAVCTKNADLRLTCSYAFIATEPPSETPVPWFPDVQAIDFAVGDIHACALTPDRRVFCAGEWGMLGVGLEGRPVFATYLDMDEVLDRAAKLEEEQEE